MVGSSSRRRSGRANRVAAGAGLRRVRLDIGQPRLDLGDPVGIRRGLRFGEQGGALGIGGQHHIHQCLVAAGRFLGDRADAHALLHTHIAALRNGFAADQPEQGRLARTVPPDQTHLGLGRQEERRLVEQHPAFDAIGEVIDVQHGKRRLARGGDRCKRR